MIKIRVRVAAIIKINNGYAVIHRKNVKKNKDYSEYYTLPGGGVEKGETLEQAIIREVKEELGINVKPLKILFQNEQEKFDQKEVYFLCEYINGKFGTGDGPEYNNDIKYIDSGKYIPEIIKKEDINGLLLLPLEIKEKLIKYLNKKKEGVNVKKVRGFEVVKGYEDKNINLPERKTKYSAGYDIEAAEDTVVPAFKKGIAPTLIKTGIKAYMQDDEVLMLYNRSSNPKKKGLILANSVGVIDKDYYGNADNDGHIMFAFYNIKDEDITIKKGEAIGQGVFQKYFKADYDEADGVRTGGFGSTSNK